MLLVSTRELTNSEGLVCDLPDHGKVAIGVSILLKLASGGWRWVLALGLALAHNGWRAVVIVVVRRQSCNDPKYRDLNFAKQPCNFPRGCTSLASMVQRIATTISKQGEMN